VDKKFHIRHVAGLTKPGVGHRFRSSSGRGQISSGGSTDGLGNR
jgi:hypothetical protein